MFIFWVEKWILQIESHNSKNILKIRNISQTRDAV